MTVKKQLSKICKLPYKHNNLMYCAKNVENKNKNMISLTKMVLACAVKTWFAINCRVQNFSSQLDVVILICQKALLKFVGNIITCFLGMQEQNDNIDSICLCCIIFF